MRIGLITQEEPFYLPPALDALCRARPQEVVALIVLPTFNEGLRATAHRLYEFYGAWDFSRLVAWYGWAKVANKLNRLAPLTRPYAAVDVARRHAVPLYQPAKINAADFVTTLRNEIRPDLLISVAASQILKARVLATPPLGCINLHSAPLPRYQGMMPNFWTMLHDEPQAAVTIHYMVEKLDAGDIIVQRPVPIHPQDSLHKLMIRSKQVGVEALLEAVAQIEQGTVQRKPMDVSQATYFSFPKRVDARQLRQMGHALL
ncbi:MAG: formyltransferase family protein [Caldilineaceae bacterium]